MIKLIDTGGLSPNHVRGGLGVWCITHLLLCYKKFFKNCITLLYFCYEKIFLKYFMPLTIRNAIENINYFHRRGNFLATYALYIVTHALLAYSPQRLARYYGVRHRVVSANSREMSPVVLKWLLYKLLG